MCEVWWTRLDGPLEGNQMFDLVFQREEPRGASRLRRAGVAPDNWPDALWRLVEDYDDTHVTGTCWTWRTGYPSTVRVVLPILVYSPFEAFVATVQLCAGQSHGTLIELLTETAPGDANLRIEPTVLATIKVGGFLECRIRLQRAAQAGPLI